MSNPLDSPSEMCLFLPVVVLTFFTTPFVFSIEEPSDRGQQSGHFRKPYFNGSTTVNEGPTLSARVVNGISINIEQRPFQVLLRILKDDGVSSICGAAHCVIDRETERKIGLNVLIVYAGKTRLLLRDLEEVKVEVAEIIVHEDYDIETLENDIAILRLRKCLSFNKYIQPIPLASKHPSQFKGKVPVTISGWGKIHKQFVTGGERGVGTILQFAQIEFVDLPTCRRQIRTHDPAEAFPPGTDLREILAYEPPEVPDNTICGTSVNIDTCGGDSGGPFVCEVPGTPAVLCGIVSFGVGCALGIPGVYTDVANFRDWIAKNTRNQNNCRTAAICKCECSSQ